MSKQRHETQIITLLEAMQANVENRRLAYTETLLFPAYDVGNGDNVVWESDQNYRAKVLFAGMYEISEALLQATLAFGSSGVDPDAYIEEFVVPSVAARTSADDSDASADFERLMLPGVTRVIPASGSVTGDGTDTGSDTGIGTLVVVVGYFE